MAITPSRQRNAVSQGMALGLVMLDRIRIEFDKTRIDLAFEDAWRGWSYRHRFPQVDTDIRNGSDGVWVMTHADENKHTWVLFWERQRELTVWARKEGWDPNDPADLTYALSVIDGDVPLDGWTSLAAAFLADFDRDFES